MIPTAAMGGQGNSVQGGDAGPATTGNQAVNPSVGAQTFNFNAPSAPLFGTGISATVIKGTLALVAVIGAVAIGSRMLSSKGK